MSLADLTFETTVSLGRCEALGSLSRTFADALERVGLTVSACGMVTGAKAVSGDPFHFVNWPSGWLTLYVEREFVRKDPLPRWALVSGLPLSFSAVKKKLSKSDPGQECYREAAKWGFTEGMAVPVRSRTGELGLVTSSGKRGPFDAREEIFIQTISAAVFHRAFSLDGAELDAPAIPAFSRREQEILNLLHHGFKDREIAQTLEISVETVRSHLENSRIKAGARSRTDLVSRTSRSVTGA